MTNDVWPLVHLLWRNFCQILCPFSNWGYLPFYCLCLKKNILVTPGKCGILIPGPGVEPVPLVFEVWNLNHWPPGKSPFLLLSSKSSYYNLDTSPVTDTRAADVLSHSVAVFLFSGWCPWRHRHFKF